MCELTPAILLLENPIQSYAAIDSIEDNIVTLEVESNSTSQNAGIPFSSRETIMVEIPFMTLVNSIGEVHEGDVIIVEHSSQKCIPIRIASEEKERRIAYLVSLL